MENDEKWMARALQLAKLGLGKVQPNPMVGAVLVHKNKIIGEGWHQQYGSPHAEVNALHSVSNPEFFKESTLYVNLEPCSHYGKTPPCTSLIIENRIPRVVIGMKDPNLKVNGNGIRILQDAGIEVITDILHDECVKLNKRFFTFHTKKRPFIILKWAETKNGYIDIVRPAKKNENYWITNDLARVWAHKLRSEEQAILVGYNTFLNDKPQLNNRLYGTNQPKRFVVAKENLSFEHTNFTFLPNNLDELINELVAQKIQSVIIEGGKKTLQLIIDSGVWDEAYILVGDVVWRSGVTAPKLMEPIIEEINIENNRIQYYANGKAK